eukprot:Sdes_comp20053_c0_seq1m12923
MDEDDEDEFDQNDHEIDPIFREKIKNALGAAYQPLGAEQSANKSDDEIISEEDEEMNDETMDKIDELLSKAFRENLVGKKNRKQGEEEKKKNLVHFKSRVLNLVDIFIRQTKKPI